jgi:hypothetical protein
MRPTWHFVAAEDLRWLLQLTAPRVHQASAYQYRQLELDLETRKRSRDVIRGLLHGGRALLREELAGAMADAGVLGSRLRLGYMLIDAELEAVVCSGPRRGRRQTYALLDERVPRSRPRERDEALAELATRYVQGHGPAQDVDLAWWSGLTLREARTALEAAGTALARETVDGRTFWVHLGEAQLFPSAEPPSVHLLPNYDELLVAFRDRSDAMDPNLPPPARAAAEILAHVVVRNGLVIGGWSWKDAGGSTAVAVEPKVALDAPQRAAIGTAIARLEAFLGRPVEVSGLD